MRKILVALVLITAASTLAFGQARCKGTNLRARHFSDDAGAGQRGVVYSFTNKGYRRCTLKGYPGFALLNRFGRRIGGIHIIKKPGPAQLVTLARNGKAYFDITYSSCQTVGDPPCKISSKVRITPPHLKRVFILPDSLDPFEGRINLSPVRAVAEP